ncbi:MAG TPA: alpha/beta hydrolase [Caulobacteraceae bacterium]|nr:alpha/beta hydrolase [Caulobacteraceae bacterium]
MSPSRRALLAALPAAAATTPALAQAPAPQPAPADAYAPAREIIANVQRIVSPNGIELLETVQIGGIPQWVSIRGNDRDNPVLLFVHGGPGSPEMPVAWTFQRGWEEYFTVVQWDQRGAGKTNRANDADAIRPTLTFARMEADAVEMIDHLCARFGRRRIVVVGTSWGSMLGLRAALKRPEKVHAYVGIGQLISMRENERVGYDYALRRARAENNTDAIRELESLAPYPGAPGTLTFERIGLQRKWTVHYGSLSAYRTNADQYFRAMRLSPQYEPADLKAVDPGGVLSVTALLPELLEADLSGVTRTPFPVVLMLGRHDYTTPSEIAEAWLGRLTAPKKKLVWFEHSAHVIPVEEPGRTLVTLVQDVLPLVRE